MKEFPKAPNWFSRVLNIEDFLLKKGKRFLPSQPLEEGGNSFQNRSRSDDLNRDFIERIVPGQNSSPYLIQHISRYLWAMDKIGKRSVIDLGSGDGYGTHLLSWSAKKAVGVDIDQDLLMSAASKYGGIFLKDPKEANLYPGPQPIFFQADLSSDFDFPKVDVAVCFEVLEHLEEPESLIDAVSRSGVEEMILSVPNPLVGGSHINPHHLNNWSLGAFKKILKDSGAVKIKSYNQGLYSYPIRRGAFYQNSFWIMRVFWR